MSDKGMSVTPDEIQAVVQKQASLIGSLQTQKMLLESRVERLEAQLAELKAQVDPVVPEGLEEALATS